jgi:hypothetical protein
MGSANSASVRAGPRRLHRASTPDDTMKTVAFMGVTETFWAA